MDEGESIIVVQSVVLPQGFGFFEENLTPRSMMSRIVLQLVNHPIDLFVHLR